MKCKSHHTNKFLFPHLPIFFQKNFRLFKFLHLAFQHIFIFHIKKFFEEVPVEHAVFLKILLLC